jgi:hypothetical protein
MAAVEVVEMNPQMLVLTVALVVVVEVALLLPVVQEIRHL